MIRSRDGALRLGPQDAGIELEHDEFVRAEWAPGFRYELVAGRLAVTPAPDFPSAEIENWFLDALKDYARLRPDVLQRVMAVSRVLTRTLGAATNVQPDVAAYRQYPVGARHGHWRDAAPLLVVEVLSADDPKKDLVRNREIYELVPSIQEYWIVDPRPAAAPSMLALRRGPAGGWIEHAVPPGGAYRTEVLPGLELDLGAIFREPRGHARQP